MHFEQFWEFYISQHSKASTRRWHFAGTLTALVLIVASLFFSRLWLAPLGIIIGYGLAWYSHFFVEHNVPATFGHPLWSFLCDCRMFILILTGRMDSEVSRLNSRCQ